MYIKSVKMPKKIICGIYLLFASMSANALDLGQLSILSDKSQPLRAELNLGNVSDAELSALKLEITSSSNVDLKVYGIQSVIEKSSTGYIAKISTKKPLPSNVLDIKIQSDVNGIINQKLYSNIIKGSNLKNQNAEAIEVIQPNAKPNSGNKNRFSVSTDGKYVVKPGDNLYTISGEHSKTLSDVSLDQVIVAIYQQNTNAFLGGNMNRLKSGAELSLPNSEEASKYDQRGAKQEIIARTTQYNRYKNRLSEFVTKRLPEGQASTSQKGNVNTQAAKVEITTPTNDTLKITKTNSASSTMENQIAEDVAKKEMGEAKIQSEALAKKQQELDELKNNTTASTTNLNENLNASEVTTPPDSPFKQDKQDKKDDPLGLSSGTAADNSSSSANIENQEVASQTSQVVTEKTKKKALWPFLLIGLGLSGIGFYAYKRKKNKNLNNEEDSLFNSDFEINSDSKDNSIDYDNFSLVDDAFSTDNGIKDNNSTSSISSNIFNSKNKINEEKNVSIAKSDFDDDSLFNDDLPVLDNPINVTENNDIKDNNKNIKNDFANAKNIQQAPEEFLDSLDNLDSKTNDQSLDFNKIPTLSDNDQVITNDNSSMQSGFYDTKLELAKAYLDIEDLSGARMLLEELVSQNEDKKVQKEAKSILKQINS